MITSAYISNKVQKIFGRIQLDSVKPKSSEWYGNNKQLIQAQKLLRIVKRSLCKMSNKLFYQSFVLKLD